MRGEHDIGCAERAIRIQFSIIGNPATIPLMNGKDFSAELVEEGVMVSNLGNQPFLPWEVFEETIVLLRREGGRALRGSAMGNRLGQPGLTSNSVEGNIAARIYGKHVGDSVFRRISPVAAILIWAGLCRHVPNELIMNKIIGGNNGTDGRRGESTVGDGGGLQGKEEDGGRGESDDNGDAGGSRPAERDLDTGDMGRGPDGERSGANPPARGRGKNRKDGKKATGDTRGPVGNGDKPSRITELTGDLKTDINNALEDVADAIIALLKNADTGQDVS